MTVPPHRDPTDPTDQLVQSRPWITPRAAYLHVPFCRHRCGYCNFSVIADRDDWIDRFLIALDLELASLDQPVVDTVFLGGGTPTHLNEAQLERLLKIIRTRFDVARDAEWSIEANPEDVTREKLDLLEQHGVNRISLGIQSFQVDKLITLERTHDSAKAIEAIELAASRIANVSIDLIFGAPGETLAVWEDDLSIALRMPIRHLSTYALTFEKGTSFWSRRNRGELQSTDESEEVEMYQLARHRTVQHGMQHYEISNFALPGFPCRHNLAYWEGIGWYAAGPGAARFVNGIREVNHRSTSTYLKRLESGQSAVAERETISLEQYARERAAFGIRMLRGVDLGELSASVGIDVAALCRDAIALSDAQGLVSLRQGRVQLTEKGILFADTVAARLLG